MAMTAVHGARAQAGASATIVVTATGMPQDRDESGQAITLIDAATIDRRLTQTVADLLATTPSVRVSSNGSLGSVTSVSLRGAEVGQTLVLLDGVRVNDPSSTSDATDFGNLLTGNIRRIEVLRGSNAIPYGSDAIGGIINLSTRDPDAPEGLSLRASSEAGYAGTLSGTADAGWRRGDLRLDAGLAALRTDGISSADSALGARERDGLRNLTGHMSAQVPLSDAATLDLRVYGIDAQLDYDSFFGAPADSADTSHFMQGTVYAGLRARSFGGRLDSRFSLSWLGNRRDYRFMPDTPPDFGYRGTHWRAAYAGKFVLARAVRLLFGYAHDAPVYRFFGFGAHDRYSARSDGAYGMAILQPTQNLTLTGGLRHDVHSQFGGVTTLGANANWGLSDGRTHVRFAYGEGFRAPSLYQLYDSYVGTAGLVPERSESIDLGLDRSFADGRGKLALTAFSRVTRHQIDYDPAAAHFANLARTRARGLEMSLTLEVDRDNLVDLTYSMIDTRDRSPESAAFNAHLARRPVNSASLSLDHRWFFGLSTGGTLRLVGPSRDPTAPDGRLAGYALLGLRARFPLNRALSLYVRLDNAFNARYETAYGYGTYGRAAYGGVRMRL